MANSFINFALREIYHTKTRTGLTVLGIIIGIAAIVALITVSNGLEIAIKEQFEKLGSSIVRVVPKGLRGPPTDTDTITKSDLRIVKNVKGLEYVAELLLQNAKVEFNNQEKLNLVNSINVDLAVDAFKDLNFEIEEGRNFEKTDLSSVIVGSKVGSELFDKKIKLKNTLVIESEKFKVIGILKETGTEVADNVIYIPLEKAREIFDKPDEISVIAAKVQEGLDVKEIQEKIKSRLKHSRDNENFDVITPAQFVEQLSLILSVIQFILTGIAAISLVVGGIGIMNSMFTAVLERTREIGVMKAIGAKRSQILSVFLFQAGIIGLFGGIVGTALGISLSFLVGFVAKSLDFGLLQIKVDLLLILFNILFAFVIGMVSGALPAYNASKLNPVDALRYE